MRRSILVGLAVGSLLATRAAPALAASADDPIAYQQHLKAAAQLIEEEDFAGAEVELEAAYAAQKKPQPLLEIARCEKARYRQPQAIAALERALAEQGARMSPAERAAAQKDLSDLQASLARLEVAVSPKGATLRLDGEDLPASALSGPIVLGPGAHRLEARLDGHVPSAQTVTLGSGEKVTVKIELSPAPAGAPADGAAPVEAPASRGAYALAAVSLFLPASPSDFSGTGLGLSGGARVGYRCLSFLGVEALFEYAHASASGKGNPSLADTAPDTTYPLSYSLGSARFGAGVRLMTTGQRVRFVQSLTGGVMLDSIAWTSKSVTRTGASGVDGFGQSETGVEVDLSSVLLGLTFQQTLGSSGGLVAISKPTDKFAPGAYGGPQYGAGLGLRAGYRWW